MITRRNLCTNPSFEVDVAHWSASTGQGTTITRDTTVHNGGVASAKSVTPTGGNAAGIFTDSLPVYGGQTYSASAWWKVTTALTSPVFIQFRWFDASGATISTTLGGSIQAVGSGTLTLTDTAPANAATVKFRLLNNAASTGTDTFWADTVIVERASTPGTYFDGNTAAAGGVTYAWDGTANESTSKATVSDSHTRTYPQGLSRVTRRNLCTNPSFEVDLTSWSASTAQGVTLTRDTTVHDAGTASGKVFVPSGAGANAGIFTDHIPITAGKVYTASAWWSLTTPLVASAGANSVDIALRWFDASGATISDSAPGDGFLGGTPTSFGWVAGSGRIAIVNSPAPANAASMNVRILTEVASTADGAFWIDSVMVEQAATMGTYFDGSTAPDGSTTYAWDGTPGLSTSSASVNTRSTRTNRYPDLRNGATIHMLTDTHYKSVDWPTFAQNWTERMEADVEFLKIATNRGHVHTGDMINWHELVPGGEYGTDAVRVEEESRYLTFRAAVQANDGLPWAEAAGNHDLAGISVDGTATGDRVPRTSEQWATDVGLDSPLQAVDFGELRVLAFAPETWGSLPDSTMDWLEARLSEDARPTFLAYHIPLEEQYGPDGPGDGSAIDANGHNQRILDIIGAHTNLVGWLSGHYHINVQSPAVQKPHASVVSVSGRNLFVINGPSATNMANSGVRWWNGKAAASMYLSLLDENTLDVRWRNHFTRSWYGSQPGESHRLLDRNVLGPV